jgi:hypothetical protein
MINQLLKLGALISTGRFLKPRIKGLICVMAAWLLLWFLHSEYVSYVELSGDTGYVLYVTIAKIAIYALSIGIYVLVVEKKLWPKPVKVPSPAAASTRGADRDSGKTQAVHQGQGDDGFDFLRKKKKLGTGSKEV